MKKLFLLFFLPLVACADFNKVTVNDTTSSVGQLNTVQGTGTTITTYQVPTGVTWEQMTGSSLKLDYLSTAGVVTNSASGVIGNLFGTNGNFLGYSGGVLGFYAPTVAAGGSNTQIQYNNSGVLAGAAGFTYSSGQVSNIQSASFMDSLLILQNTNNGTVAGAALALQNSSSSLVLEYAGTGYTGSLLTNGPTGITGAISTAGANSLALGTNFTSAVVIDTAQNVSINNFSTAGVVTNNASGKLISTLTPSMTSATFTQATGSAPFTVSSTTNVANLNASSLNGATFAAPGAIGSTTANTGQFTTITMSGTGQDITATGAAGSDTYVVVGDGTVKALMDGVGSASRVAFGSLSNHPVDIRVNNGAVATFTSTGLTTTGTALSSSATAGVGYTTGSGGTVTQATSRTTGVTLNTVTGQITGNNTSLAASTAVSFTVSDTAVAATDVVVLIGKSGVTLTTDYKVTAIAAGSFTITEYNINSATADTGTPVLQFAVIKGSNN